MNSRKRWSMRYMQRKLMRSGLDDEMRPYRRAGDAKNPTNGLLRAVRHAVGIPTAEIAGKMGVNRSCVFEMERRELRRKITLQSLGRISDAMGCKVVYGIVPLDGKTLEEIVVERLWAKALGALKKKENFKDEYGAVAGNYEDFGYGEDRSNEMKQQQGGESMQLS